MRNIVIFRYSTSPSHTSQAPRTELEEFSVHVGSVCQQLMLCEIEAELTLEEEDDLEVMGIFRHRLLTNGAFNVRDLFMGHA
jgi:hypothetical protein